MRPSVRGLLTAGFVLVAVLAAAVPVTAGETATGTELTPAKVERDQATREVDLTFTVINHDPEPRSITARITGLGHDLDGTPTFEEDQAPPLRAAPDSFVLAPRSRTEVRVTGRIPEGRGGVYAGLLVEARPDPSDDSGDGTGVSVRTRVGGLILVRGPRPWQETVSIEDVALTRASAEGRYDVAAIIRNRGDVHVRPAGEAVIRRAGRELGSVRLEGETILPGYARRIHGEWAAPGGLEGPVEIEVTLDDPPATYMGDVDVPVAIDLTVRSLSAHRDGSGRPFVRAEVEALGTSALERVTGELELSSGSGGLRAGPFNAEVRSIAAGGTGVLTFQLDPQLPTGPWSATVTARSSGIARTVEATITFPEGTGESSDPVPAEEIPPHRDRGVLIPVAAGLLFLMLVLFGTFWLFFRRRREDDAEDEEGAEVVRPKATSGIT